MQEKTTLEELAQTGQIIYLDNCVVGLDFNRWEGASYMRGKFDRSFVKRLGAAKRFREIKQSRLSRQIRQTENLLQLVFHYDNFQVDPFFLKNYEKHIKIMNTSLNYLLAHSSSKPGEKEAGLREIIALHQALYSLLEERNIYGKSEFRETFSFLMETLLHRPYGWREATKYRLADFVTKEDASLVGCALLAAAEKGSEVAIVTADKDIPNLVRNFGRNYHQGGLPEEVKEKIKLEGTLRVYFSSPTHWFPDLGIDYMCDSFGDYRGYVKKKAKRIFHLRLSPPSL